MRWLAPGWCWLRRAANEALGCACACAEARGRPAPPFGRHASSVTVGSKGNGELMAKRSIIHVAFAVVVVVGQAVPPWKWETEAGAGQTRASPPER